MASAAADYFQRANRATTMRRGPWLGILRNAAFGAGGAWIAASTIDHLRFATSDDRSSSKNLSVFRWVRAIDSIATRSSSWPSLRATLWLRGLAS
jgi:hypothetical protein